MGVTDRVRCGWATSAPEYVAYHDDEWGRPLHGVDALYERLMGDAGIVRNRRKIEATIANARAVLDLDVGLDELLWSFAPDPSTHRRPASLAEVPATSAESTAMAKELRRRGFRFVGPTTCYALMQAVGLVDDHVATCWRAGPA